MTLGKHDPFGNLDSWSPKFAESWATALRLRTAGVDQRRLRRRIVELAGLRPGDQMAEIGCGTGALLLDLAEAVGPGGRVTGYEPQHNLAAAAQEAVAAAGAGANIEVVRAGAADLELEPASLHAVIEQTVFIHLPQFLILDTLARALPALRPGGRWVSADQDGDTWIIDHPDRELTRRIIAFNSDFRYADGWTGRRLSRLLAEAGFIDVQVDVLTHVDTAPGSYLHGMALRIAESARTEGALSTAEYDRWVGRLSPSAGYERFYSSINYYVAVGRRAEIEPTP